MSNKETQYQPYGSSRASYPHHPSIEEEAAMERRDAREANEIFAGLNLDKAELIEIIRRVDQIGH